MEIFHLVHGRPLEQLASIERLPDEGYIWLDFQRDIDSDWAKHVEPLVGVPIDPRHIIDSFNTAHPSFFDDTPDYEMLVFAGLGPRDEPLPIETRPATFFLFERLLVSVRAPDNVSFGILKRKLNEGRVKPPECPAALVHAVLDTMVDRFLAIRNRLEDHFNELQEALLDPMHPLEDWRELLSCRREARKLESLCEQQLESLDAWKRGAHEDFSPSLQVRLHDLTEHVTRVLNYAANQERDLEAAVQLYFAVATERTNRVVQTLTVVSAIFLPLTLMAGLWGMNFEYMPELKWRYGYFAALGGMVTFALVLLAIFKRRRYF